jgi:predicted dehydrogenase
MVQPVRWGILSTARIATKKVIPGMLKSSSLTVSAIASRDSAQAQLVASELGIIAAYGSYEELLADPQIEAVYIPLPNHLHIPMTLAAVRAGKHVLCEKPMALLPRDLDALRPYSDQVHIREAFMIRFHPQWIEARNMIRRGEIGEPKYMHVCFSYFNDNPEDIRNRIELGGGALYDIGCYAVVAGRWLFDSAPSRAAATIDRDDLLGTDRCTSGLIEFSRGRQLAFSVSTQATRYQSVLVVGTSGRIEFEIPFNAPQDAPCRLLVSAHGGNDGDTNAISFPVADQYQLQAESFSEAVRNEQPDARGIDDAYLNARTIDALFRSARSSQFETV